MHPARQSYVCGHRGRPFDDVTSGLLAVRHQPWQTWMRCLDRMGLNRSHQPIAQELGWHKDDVQQMTCSHV